MTREIKLENELGRNGRERKKFRSTFFGSEVSFDEQVVVTSNKHALTPPPTHDPVHFFG